MNASSKDVSAEASRSTAKTQSTTIQNTSREEEIEQGSKEESKRNANSDKRGEKMVGRLKHGRQDSASDAEEREAKKTKPSEEVLFFVNSFVEALLKDKPPPVETRREEPSKEKRNRKREINRLSARRKRAREKEELKTLDKTLKSLSAANEKLRANNEKLMEIMRKIEAMKEANIRPGAEEVRGLLELFKELSNDPSEEDAKPVFEVSSDSGSDGGNLQAKSIEHSGVGKEGTQPAVMAPSTQAQHGAVSQPQVQGAQQVHLPGNVNLQQELIKALALRGLEALEADYSRRLSQALTPLAIPQGRSHEQSSTSDLLTRVALELVSNGIFAENQNRSSDVTRLILELLKILMTKESQTPALASPTTISSIAASIKQLIVSQPQVLCHPVLSNQAQAASSDLSSLVASCQQQQQQQKSLSQQQLPTLHAQGQQKIHSVDQSQNMLLSMLTANHQQQQQHAQVPPVAPTASIPNAAAPPRDSSVNPTVVEILRILLGGGST